MKIKVTAACIVCELRTLQHRLRKARPAIQTKEIFWRMYTAGCDRSRKVCGSIQDMTDACRQNSDFRVHCRAHWQTLLSCCASSCPTAVQSQDYALTFAVSLSRADLSTVYPSQVCSKDAMMVPAPMRAASRQMRAHARVSWDDQPSHQMSIHRATCTITRAPQ